MRKAIGRILIGGLVFGLAACNEAPVSPAAKAPAVLTGGSMATLTQNDTVRFTFTINPAAYQSVYVGAGNSVRFPAGSVCDPSSSYGATEWDNACTPATSPVTVDAAAWLDANGHPRVDFGSHLRFVPTTNPNQYVTIVFTDTVAAQNPSSDILYCANTYAACVSELSGDASLVTVKNPTTGQVTRRIKHFSGYVMGSGEECVPSIQNPDCQEGGAGMNRVGNGLSLPTGNTASATIGPNGGVLRLPSAGLTVVVPRGALSKKVTLSVSPRAGQFLAYEFQPHGTKFAKALRVTQDLRGADWSGNSLSAVYYANESQLDDATGDVQATELMDVDVDAAAGTASFEIHHFSGYMFATGTPCQATSVDPKCGETDTSVGDAPVGTAALRVAAPKVRFSGIKRAGATR